MSTDRKNRGLDVIQIIPRNIHFPPDGGDAVRVYSQSKALARSGCRIHIISFASSKQHVDVPNALFYPITGEVTVVPSCQQPKKRFSIARAFRDLILFFLKAFFYVKRKGRNSRIMHAHTPEGGMIALGVKLLTGTPFVYDPHDWYYENWILVYVNVSLFSRKILSLAYRILASVLPRMADATIVVSNYMVKCIPHAKRKQIVPNAIDPKYMLSVNQTTQKRSCAKKIVFAGSIAKHQGLEILLNAFSKVCARRSDVELWIVGDGEYLTFCELLARKLQIDSRVKFKGRCSRDDALRIVAQADTCVAPFLPESFCMTGCPIKILEYAALGKKIVATDLPVIRDLLEDYQLAFLSRPYQQELSEKLLEALSFTPPNCMTKHEKNLFSFPKERFNEDTIGSTLIQLYHIVLGEKAQ